MIKYHTELVQGSEEWLSARCGLLTASEMCRIITPSTLKAANNAGTRGHLYELLAQRITRHVEPRYITDDMLRGMQDEIIARGVYAERYAPVTEVGFITNDRFGFTIGYSPDGLVGDDGLIECKSRGQKFQLETIIEYVSAGKIPPDYMLQIQTGLLVSERKWADFISYCGGIHMATVRVLPDQAMQDAIVAAAAAFEAKLTEKMAAYHVVLKSEARLIPTERRVDQEMYI